VAPAIASVLHANLLRTSSFRLTVLYVGLFSASVLILFAVIYFATAGYMARQLDRAIAAELSDLEEEAQVGGTNRLATMITERQSATPTSGSVYLLQDGKGEHLAGNLQPRRPVIGWFDFHGRSRVEEGEQPHRIRVLGKKQEDGSYVLVGQDASQLDEVEGLIIDAFSWSAAVTLLLALGGGMLISANIGRRVASVARTSQAIMAGDLSRRVPSRGVGDEFDQLADTLNAMLARIEALMEGLKQVSNDVAHELRTPLSRLRQRFEAVQRGTPSPADYESLVDQSTRDIDAMLETFASMLRIAEVEAIGRTVGFTAVDLSDVLRTVLEVYEPLAHEKSQTLSGRIAANLTVHGNRELLTQVFANLAENAIKHSPEGAHITVDAMESSGAIEAVVADTGPGIPADERDKVFRRFYRLESSRTTRGSGLGLSLVSAIAVLHGIEISLSDNSPGLRVRLRFPKCPQSF
jgi:signal transduction histidine kinase